MDRPGLENKPLPVFREGSALQLEVRALVVIAAEQAMMMIIVVLLPYWSQTAK